jgi:tetratricopeptide (TPR) repeat protein
VILLLAVSTLALLSLRRRPYLMVGWLWFVGMLIPVCGLMQTGPQSIADRYTYLPSIGLSVALVWTLCDLARQDRPVILKQTLLSGAAVLLVGVCAVLTHRQLAHWRNTETLMGRVLEIDPNNYIAHGNLGVCLSKQGRTPEALFHYQRARELDPDLRGATTNTNGGK